MIVFFFSGSDMEAFALGSARDWPTIGCKSLAVKKPYRKNRSTLLGTTSNAYCLLGCNSSTEIVRALEVPVDEWKVQPNFFLWALENLNKENMWNLIQ